MENDRDRLVIIAGYDHEIDRLPAANGGLASRFAKRLRFPSYSPQELGRIRQLIAHRRDSEIPSGALALLVHSCTDLYLQERIEQADQPNRRGIDLAGNGRFVRNVIESAEEEREFRLACDTSLDLAGLDTETLMRIGAADMHTALQTVLTSLRLDRPSGSWPVGLW